MYFSITKRKKRFLIVASIAAVALLLFRPGILGKKVDVVTPSVLIPKGGNSRIPLNTIFSVAVEDRHFYLARKVGKGEYELINVAPYHELALCQIVKSTGFDQQLNPDVTIGLITSIEHYANDIYPTVIVSHRHSCASDAII